MSGQAAVLAPLEEFASLSPEAMAHVRNRWIAAAYEKLPELTRQERDLAQDRMLAAECSMWRVRFREAEKERDHQRWRAEQAEAQIDHLMERIEHLIRGLEPNHTPELPGATT